MAGRPRLYANAAEKTRAYREREANRTVKMDRVTLEQIEEHLNHLRHAVYAAQERGDPLARSLKTVTWLDMLTDLTYFFETGTPIPKVSKTHRKGGDKTAHT